MNMFIRTDRVFIVAEAGVNHNGDPDLAVKLINAAADFYRISINLLYVFTQFFKNGQHRLNVNNVWQVFNTARFIR